MNMAAGELRRRDLLFRLVRILQPHTPRTTSAETRENGTRKRPGEMREAYEVDREHAGLQELFLYRFHDPVLQIATDRS
jgi:hypothetical protein